MTPRDLGVLIAVPAVLALLVAWLHGYRRGSRHSDGDIEASYRAGVRAEAARWEKQTGATLETLVAWRRPDEPEWQPTGPIAAWAGAESHVRTGVNAPGSLGAEAYGDSRRQPPPDATALLGPPSASVLLAEAARQGYTGPLPSAADRVIGPLPDEHDISEEEFEAAKADLLSRHGAIPPSLQSVMDHGGRFAPVVAEITDVGGIPRYPGPQHALTDWEAAVTGVVVTAAPEPDRTGPDWVDYQIAAMDADTAAYLRRVEAEMASFRRGLPAGPVGTGAMRP